MKAIFVMVKCELGQAYGVADAARPLQSSPSRHSRRIPVRDGAKRMSDDTGWVRAASRGKLGEGDVLGVVIGGKEIAI
jgi:hypothetical protein